ncbi:MAG: Apolipoprotein N-acyltransferase [Candidatus Marinimicrobia bacterium]|nr:Apolipoprotein N-acyltransferase [Candidatus Neomarinimicrobiota bacterium]
MPFGFLAYIGLIPLYYALSQTNGMHSFRLGYLTGLVYTGGMIFWIGMNSGTYRWAAILSAVMAVAFMALNVALFGWALGYLIKKDVPGKFWWAPVLWVTVEFFRSFGTLIMPWVNLSLSQTHYLPAIQVAGITGMYGVSFWVVLLSVIIFQYLSAKDAGTIAWRWAVIAGLVYIIPLLYGTIILRVLPGHNQGAKSMKVAVIQPNVDPNQKWDKNFRQRNFDLLLSLTKRGLQQNPDIIVWPESATPSYLRFNRYGYLTVIRNLVDSTGVPILTGTPDWEPPDKNSAKKTPKGKYYNGAVLIEPGKQVTQRYRKIKLVPFAEYVPYEWIFGFFNEWELGQGYFTPGKEYTVFEYENTIDMEMSVAICYDSSFPKLIRKFRTRGAEWLAIITNDAWFGISSGPFQHAEWAKMRAVETRMPIARSANTGISMLIDGWGRVQKRLPLNKQGVLVDTLEIDLRPTFYARFGNVFSIIATLLGLGVLVWGVIRK